MKLKNALILLVTIAVVAGLSASASAYRSFSNAIPITSQGTIPFTPGALLDDFRNAKSGLNVWNCATGAFSSSAASITASCITDTAIVYGGTGNSLKLTYNVDAMDSYAGYFTNLGGGNVSSYTAVSFYVKGANGGELIKIELKNKSGTVYHDDNAGTDYFRNVATVYVPDFLAGGVTTAWQKVTIPLKNFANLDGFTSMNELVFVFENTQSGINGSRTHGAVYIDNIKFENPSVDVLGAAYFGTKLNINSLGGYMAVTGGTSGGSGSISFASLSDGNHTAANALKYNYNVSVVGSYAAAFSEIGGGNTDSTVQKPEKGGWIAIRQDFSAYNYITFWARAATDATNPTGFKVELHDFSGIGTGEPFYKINKTDTNHLTTAWQKYSIPLANFMDWSSVPLEKNHIAEIVFTIEYYNTPGDHDVGAMYIDDVQFEK